MPLKRTFSLLQKRALYLIADGKCQLCGIPLEKGWHADHIIPYALGGQTEIINGQALCANCNLKKGKESSDIMLKKWDKPLREWQINALSEWETVYNQAIKGFNFLLVATPGAGKTLFSLKLAHQLLESRRIEQIVIVCPTSHLKTQWAEKAHEIGIDIDPNWASSGNIPKDFQGIALTYAMVASTLNANILKKIIKRSSLIILDEIHHTGDDSTWGSSIKTAFDHVDFKLLLSGTPFRTDNQKIPFVRYDLDTGYADYKYGYGNALRDNVCRPVYFPSYEGTMEWVTQTGEYVKASFGDELAEQQVSERLKTALNANGEWIKTVLKQAHDNLLQIREEHSNAAGLVIAMDMVHAKKIADVLEKQTGEKPVLAISEEPDASKKIEEFTNGRQKWIIAIKMVSEGVDIPRLRVLVHATNISSELFFRQAVGRVIRVVPYLEEQGASFYMPSEKLLLTYAKRIKEERDHTIEEVLNDTKFDEEVEIRNRLRREITFQPLQATAVEGNVIFDHDEFSPSELNPIENQLKEMGYHNKSTALLLAKLLRENNIGKSDSTENTVTDPKYKRKADLRRNCETLVRRFAYMSGTEAKTINAEWLRISNRKQDNASEEELFRKLEWIKKKIASYGK
jgi:superfamily II DNA or RNA helicase